MAAVSNDDHPAYRAITGKPASGIKGARPVVIPGATHLIQMDKPKELNAAVLDFLGQQ